MSEENKVKEVVVGKWTDAEKDKVIAAYVAGKPVKELASEFNRTTRSITGKLVAEKVYVVPEKKVTKKVEGPSKKDILREIEKTGFEVEGFDNVTKDGLTRLNEYLRA